MSTPRVGFLGVGWIGRHRMQAIIETGAVAVAGIAEPSPEMAAAARALAPDATLVPSLDALLDLGLDGVVIATPSALHAAQSIRALERSVAVFCQKPLGRDAAEVRAVVQAAQTADRLLAVDLSYRFTAGMRRIREIVRAGELGHVHAVELVFHNGYGPDKPWFYDRALSGGGCVMDLGVHLVDLALWVLDFPVVAGAFSRLSSQGRPLAPGDAAVEDFATATLTLETGTTVQLACSWRLPVGREAAISAAFYGTEGGAALRNVDGSFFDFTAERFRGTSTEPLTAPPDAWGGRAAADWAMRLAAGVRFDPETERMIRTAEALDRIYAGS